MQLLDLKTKSNKQQTVTNHFVRDSLYVLLNNIINLNEAITFILVLAITTFAIFKIGISSFIVLPFLSFYLLNIASEFNHKLFGQLILSILPVGVVQLLHVSLISNFGSVVPGILLLQMSLISVPWLIFEDNRIYLYFGFFISITSLITTYFYSGEYSLVETFELSMLEPLELISCFISILLFSLLLLISQRRKTNFKRKNEQLIRSLRDSQTELNTLVQSAKKQSWQINRLNKKLELKALRAQMSPHFIFNALNSIQHLLSENENDEAMSYLLQFAKLVRGVLEKSPSSSVNLDTEIRFLTTYLELEKLRFENQFQYDLLVDKSLDPSETLVPFLLIQPYVENAILHGLVNKDGSKQLNVSFYKESDQDTLLCIVDDNGIGREKAIEIKKRKTHVYESKGMALIDRRLSLLNYGMKQKILVHIIDKKGPTGNSEGTRIEIRIPLKFEYND